VFDAHKLGKSAAVEALIQVESVERGVVVVFPDVVLDGWKHPFEPFLILFAQAIGFVPIKKSRVLPGSSILTMAHVKFR
jgi:hypothetical protein